MMECLFRRRKGTVEDTLKLLGLDQLVTPNVRRFSGDLLDMAWKTWEDSGREEFEVFLQGGCTVRFSADSR